MMVATILAVSLCIDLPISHRSYFASLASVLISFLCKRQTDLSFISCNRLDFVRRTMSGGNSHEDQEIVINDQINPFVNVEHFYGIGLYVESTAKEPFRDDPPLSVNLLV